MQKIIYTKKEIFPMIGGLVQKIPERSVICFHGQMGSGKTTLIKGIVKHLGGFDKGNSPSFGIVNEYTFPDGQLLGYHFDFYRLNNAEEALDLGLEDYLNQDVWIFIEWPEKVEGLLPENRLNIYLESLDSETRQLILEAT
ncbi:tRNA (adenosine(37)-N6)-threonylcarbamoyltransferase complex ATPase subunit type 1 TsaE [Muriicola sp.]|uniref:tRNA (adenosine(37)-N6)-threonylcarbamoyltransferase complex ATPase subunit type 1 TsaE n=1 Tax=Muriicola sp. TaxID=2020856 RepID=UPI003565110C